MKILVACRHIDQTAGGVERQATALLNEMDKRGHEASLFTMDLEGATSFYPINPNVTWHKLNHGNSKQKAGWKSRWQRAKKIRALITEHQPDVILAFQQGMFLSLRLYLMGLNTPIIAAERESPYRFDFIKDGKHKNLIFQSFRLARNITVQCESYIKAYPKYLQKRITAIPNAILASKAHAKPAGQAGEPKTLLCVARLSFAKNQTVLIEAFSKIHQNHPNWTLTLAGDGEDQTTLEAQAKSLGIKDKVTFAGAVKDVATLYQNSHLFCLPSRWEGFPNALGEALSHGLPSIGYQNCGGVRDLIDNNTNGLLAEGNGNVDSLATALDTLMGNDALRKNMGAAAIQSIKPYAHGPIYDCWESFLSGVIKGQGANT